MKRETFIKAIDAIEKQDKYDTEVGENLGKAFPSAFEANLLPDNHFVSNALFDVLQEEMGDNEPDEYGQSWIKWFCFDKEFGTRNDIKAYHKDGTEIKLNNAGDLYDFLESERAKKLQPKQ